jgi:hypothetical protein
MSDIMKERIITADGVKGYLEHAGRIMSVDHPLTRHCWRREVRKTRAGFEVQDVRFDKSKDGWREARRDTFAFCQSRSEAIELVNQHERSWRDAVADDLAEQRDRERREAAWERTRLDVRYRDGMMPREALQFSQYKQAEGKTQGMERKAGINE